MMLTKKQLAKFVARDSFLHHYMIIKIGVFLNQIGSVSYWSISFLLFDRKK